MLLIVLTLPVTHKNINHNYDKITEPNVSEGLVTATDVESDQYSVCNNWHVCVCLRMNGRLIEGPLSAVKIALLQSLYLSCANIAKVVSPNTIHLHIDV